MAEVLGFEIALDQSYETAIESVTAALKTQGFGILTRIDVKATMKEKLGVDFRPYAILGACNPPIAHRALTIAPEVGLLLPCNVTIEETGAGKSLVRIANPAIMVQSVNHPDSEMAEVAAAALEKINKVVELLKTGA